MEKQFKNIAIIGMACVFPGAHSPQELWQNILAGRRYFRKLPDERLPKEYYYDPNPQAPGKTYADQAALITDWVFNPLDFRLAPNTFNASDMAHWLALYTAKEAITNSEIKLGAVDRSRIGVILGNSLTGEFSRSHNLRFRWPYIERAIRRAYGDGRFEDAAMNSLVAQIREIFESPLPEITEDSLAGNMSNTIAGRICNYFDLGAGGFTVDGACSSSLLAISTACNAIKNDEMDVVITGGVDISLDPFEIVGFAKTQALAKDDIRPYDQNAAGMLTGEGCGIVVLTSEDYARQNQHRIEAFVRGWGYSSDGSGGITAPKVEGQVRALKMAYKSAGYPINTVELIEGHGTGTALGDKVELESILTVFANTDRENTCNIGSVKANIGHCKAAAGVAGLIKTVFALKHKVLPPTVNCHTPSLMFGQPMKKLRPAIEGKIWPTSAIPRRASVSAMGFGGSNAHITLEEANPDDEPSESDLVILGAHQTTEIVLFSAKDVEALKSQIEKLIPVAERICRAELSDLSAALSKKNHSEKFRVAIIAESPWHLADSCKRILKQIDDNPDLNYINDPNSNIFAGQVCGNPKLVALFPGQGSQRLNMGKFLLRRFPFVRELCDAAEASVADTVPGGLKEKIFRNIYAADESRITAWESELKRTAITQPAITLSSMALLKVLRYFGLNPDISIGHSLGEISALCSAGAFDDLTAVRIAALRGHALESLNIPHPGAMLAISADAKTVQELITTDALLVSIANYNSMTQTVVSGDADSIALIAQICAQKGLLCRHLPVSHAFHSDIVAPAAAEFTKKISDIPFSPISAEVISTSTGEKIAQDTDLKRLLTENIRKPVQFIQAVEEAQQQHPNLWLEVGPGSVLTNLVKSIIDNNSICLPMDANEHDGFDLLNRVLANAFVLGFPVLTRKLFDLRFHRPFDPDNYHPIFITNPCERPAKTATASTELNLIPTSILPTDIEDQNLTAYLAQRASFLRQFISLDFHHFQTGRVLPVEEKIEKISIPPGPDESVEGGDNNDTVLAFATEWIAKRTGFPTAAIKAGTKLRDDLNLDSIKVGELVLTLGKKYKALKTISDPSVYANAKLGELASDFSPNIAQIPPEEKQPETTDDKSLTGISQWIHTFQMSDMSFSLADEPPAVLPNHGNAIILAENGCERATAIAKQLGDTGLMVTIADIDDLLEKKNISNEIAVFIYVLPESDKLFFRCAHDEFMAQVEKPAERLFRILRWLGHERQQSWSEFRGLVLRPVLNSENDSPDLDAGAALLKTLKLEYPEVKFKWITLPREWSPEQWAAITIQELLKFGSRVSFAYSPIGTRTSQVAAPLEVTDAAPPYLDDSDVIVASGGGKGITFELALELGKQFGVKLALLGTSPHPADNQNEGSELSINFARLAEERICFIYIQCDIVDSINVKEAISRAEKELGKITGILHGAGVSKFSPFVQMEVESYRHCIRVKTLGLYNLLAAVPPTQLKVVHVISSVLGKTGMKNQADYTLANAWLDGAVTQIKRAWPHIHCLSLGYTIWSGTGLGKKLGALDYLITLGVTPISISAGVLSYIRLVKNSYAGSVFTITGRLTQMLENNLFPAPFKFAGRFLQNIQRLIPGAELIAEIDLSFQTDLYLAEHVFQGTPIYPGVMAIEAMVQGAMACANQTEIPILRNVQFIRPLFLSRNSNSTIRIFAEAQSMENNSTLVKVAIKSDADNFQRSHFEADVIFGEKSGADIELPTWPQIPEPIQKDIEEFSPMPLFQGRFFRRIANVRKLEFEKESITEIKIPDGERYFSNNLGNATATPCPVVRDSVLQSGALYLPPGCLPAKIGEIRFFAQPVPGEVVFSHNLMKAKANNEYINDSFLFDEKGNLIEILKDIVVQLPAGGAKANERKTAPPVNLSRLDEDLKALLYNTQYGFGIFLHEQLDNLEALTEITEEEAKYAYEKTSKARLNSALGNLIAARRAAINFVKRHGGAELSPAAVQLAHHPDGKPELVIQDQATQRLFDGFDISISDCDGLSIAFIGPSPAGIDLELVQSRNTELWRGLLGDEGYDLALSLCETINEPFDYAATRVWTTIEAQKKANNLAWHQPYHAGFIGGSWHSFLVEVNKTNQELLCAIISSTEEKKKKVFTLSYDSRQSKIRGGANQVSGLMAKYSAQSCQRRFKTVYDDFYREMKKFELEFQDDPNNLNAKFHHFKFLDFIEEIGRQLKEIEKDIKAAQLIEMRHDFQNLIIEFLQESGNFRHTLIKPFGYAGDFQLLEMLVNGQVNSKGLAYHFDAWQMEYPAAQACRNRVEWIHREILDYLKATSMQKIRILDLGIGAAPIERRLQKSASSTHIDLIAVDIEPKALEFVNVAFLGTNVKAETHRLDLRKSETVQQISQLSKNVDICIAVGILEALRDEEAVRILKAVVENLPERAILFSENYLPDHPNRLFMEWFMDFHLGYRSVVQLQDLAQNAGADSGKTLITKEESGTLGLMRINK